MENEPETEGSSKPATWDMFERAAHEAFQMWMNNGDLAWARRAWRILEDARLVYVEDGAKDYHETAFRFLSLAALYCDFAELAWGERDYIDYPSWADYLSLDPFWVGYLAARAGVTAVDDAPYYEDERIAYHEALQKMADRARAEIVPALEQGLGGPVGLFLSLWNSAMDSEPAAEPDDEEEDVSPGEVDDWGPLVDLSLASASEAGPAYIWVEGHCYPRGISIR